MKHRSFFLLSFALAFGLAATVRAAGVFAGSTDFEGMAVGDLSSDGFFAGNLADSFIVSNAAIAAQIAAADRPANFDYAATRDKVLAVDADWSAPLLRNLNADGSPASADSMVYADFLAKGDAVVPAGETVEATSAADKILVYFKESNVGGVLGTNLCVLAGALNETGDGFTPHEYVLTTPAAAEPMDAGAWHRIVLVAVPEVGGLGPGFRIYLDGYGPDFLCKGAGLWLEESSQFDPSNDMDECFLSLCADYETVAPATMAAVGFAGCGAVDDFVVSTLDPASISVALSWPANLLNVSYTVDGIDGDVLTPASGSATVSVPAGSEIVLTGSSVYRTIEVTATATGAATLSLPGDGVVWYFPQTATAGQDGSQAHPFEIADADDLFVLADLVQTTNCAALFFQQVANIDFTGAGDFPGVGTYAANPTGGKPFAGTYDGDGRWISNVDFTQRNYGGLFNQVNGGTIKNLCVSNITCSGFATDVNEGEWGCAVVGNAGNGATLSNIRAFGDFGTAETPCTHNVAGIAIRLCGGGENGTLVERCENNATLHGTYTKLGGICALVQYQIAGGSVVFDACTNAADIVATANANGKNPGVDGIAGLVAYVDESTVIRRCSVAGDFSSVYGGAQIGAFVGKHHARSLTDEGGNACAATMKMVQAQKPENMTNFAYAFVSDGWATTVLPANLAVGGTYLLERNVAASETPVFTLQANGDWIAFDASLGYTFAGTVAVAENLSIQDETNGTVTTYTAYVEDSNPWFIPEAGADEATVSNNLSQAGLSPNTNVIQSTADYVALVAYVTNHVAGATVPDDLTANRKANAVLCYALNATTIPDDEIADGDMAVAAVEPAADGSMEIAIAIDGLAAGDLSTAAAQALATRALAGTMGGDDLNDLSEDNVTVQVTGSEDGKILATVEPDPNVYTVAPTTFFVKPVVSK